MERPRHFPAGEHYFQYDRYKPSLWLVLEDNWKYDQWYFYDSMFQVESSIIFVRASTFLKKLQNFK